MVQQLLRRRDVVDQNPMEHNLLVFKLCLNPFYFVSIFIYGACLTFRQEPKGDSKKRGRPPAPTKAKESAKSSDDEQAPIAKRGRGRPKGSKKRAAPKAKVCHNLV